MRARDISLAVICIGVAAPLVMMTDIFSAGPEGVSSDFIKNAFLVAGSAGVVALLIGGGATIMGFSFKVPAVLGAFLIIYTFCSTLLVTITAQMLAIAGWEIAAIFSGVFVALLAVVGVFAALEIAGGPHGPMG